TRGFAAPPCGGCALIGRGLLSELGSVQARCQAAVRPGQCSPISGNRGTFVAAELLFSRPGTTAGCCLVTRLGGEPGHSDTPFNGSQFFQQLAPQQCAVVVGLSSSDRLLGMPLSPADPLPRRRIRVLDTELAYVDTGSGDPIVFLHGNPTSSYLWRNVIPHVAARGRCLAPDLVGMGESDKTPAGSSRFVDHARGLGPEELERYRAPYREPGESRRPTLAWPREIPLDGEPADVVAVARAYADWLTRSPVPKLFVNGDPGFLLTGALRDFCRTFPN